MNTSLFEQCTKSAGVVAIALAIVSLACSTRGVAQPHLDNNWRCTTAPNADMTYMLMPNSQFSTLGVPFQTNQFGFRDGAIYQKDPNVFRILCVGDSVTFGTGVKNEETFPNVLEGILSLHSAPNMGIDVINAGVSAYNVRNIRGLIQEYLDDIQPNLVVYTFVENDLDDSVSVGPGGFLMALDPAKSPDEPFISDDFPAVWLMRREQANKGGIFDKIFSVFDNPLAAVSEAPPPLLLGDHASARQRWATFASELSRMNQVCQQSGVPLLVLSFAIRDHSEPVTEKVVETCARLGIPHASSLPVFHQDTYMKTHSLGYDPHFNRLGHQLMADRLLCFLIDQQALPGNYFGKPLPHRHYPDGLDPIVTENLRAMALAPPRTIDFRDDDGALGILAGIDIDGKMARYCILRLAAPGDRILVSASNLMVRSDQPQTIQLEVEGEILHSPVETPDRPTQFTFNLPQRFWDRDVEIRLIAGGPAWTPPPDDRLKGATAQTIQLYRVERVSANQNLGS